MSKYSTKNKRRKPAKTRDDKALDLLTRLVVAQETQSKFYEKYDKMMSSLLDTYMKTIGKELDALKSRKVNGRKKSFGEGETIGGFHFNND